MAPARSLEDTKVRDSRKQYPRWLTPAQAATYLGISIDAAHKRIQRRQLPGVSRRNGRVLIDRRLIDVWLEKGTDASRARLLLGHDWRQHRGGGS